MHYLSIRGENGAYENENCINIYSFPKKSTSCIWKSKSYMNRNISRWGKVLLGINVHSNSEKWKKSGFLISGHINH